LLRSTVLSKNRGALVSESVDNNPLFMRSDLLQGTHTSACGHVMHADCWRRWVSSAVLHVGKQRPRVLTIYCLAACHCLHCCIVNSGIL